MLGEKILLRSYHDSADRTPLTPTWELLLKSARQSGLAGATVLRGILGFGRAGNAIGQSSWSLVDHVPVIVEIVDNAPRIAQFIRLHLEPLRLTTGGMLTLERAHVAMYRHRQAESPAPLHLADALSEVLSTVPIIETSPAMTHNEPGVLLRVFIGQSDRLDGKPLHEAILNEARQRGLAGATVLLGSAGFGAKSVVHKSRLLEMSTDLPVVIEVVDTEAKTRTLLPFLESVVKDGMITMEHVQIIKHRTGA